MVSPDRARAGRKLSGRIVPDSLVSLSEGSLPVCQTPPPSLRGGAPSSKTNDLAALRA